MTATICGEACYNRLILLEIIMDALLNELSILAKGELQSLCCMMGKMMSLRCHLLAANGGQLID